MRIHFGIHQRHQVFQHNAAHPGKSACQTVDFQQHNQAHGGVVHRFAHTGGMAQHNRALQFFQILAGNAGGSQQAETGVDAVHGAVFFHNAVHAGHAAVNRGIGLVFQLNLYRLVISAAQLGQR